MKSLYNSVQKPYEYNRKLYLHFGLHRKPDKDVNVNGIVSIDGKECSVGFKLESKGKIGINYGDQIDYYRPLSKIDFSNVNPDDINIFAYGASRNIGTSAISEDNNESVDTLFIDNANLINAEEWLIQADYLSYKDPKLTGRYDLVKEILLSLLKDQVLDIYIDTTQNTPKVIFKTIYGDVRLHQLSLGYKTLIAWVVDFAKRLLDRYGNNEPLTKPAICLVDEIDLHLHPKFQRTIIQFLTETFPNTQFIVTAHSPLIVQSAGDANIILLKQVGDEVHVENDPVDVHTWRLDQILSSELFGGISGRSPQVEEKIERRRELIRQNQLNKEEKKELQQLEEEMNYLPVVESKEAIKALDILKRAAQHLK